MPSKRPSVLEDPPSASEVSEEEEEESGEEEEEESGEESEEEEEEEPLLKSALKKPSNTTSSKPDPTANSIPEPEDSSSEDVDSDEESDEDDESPEKPKLSAPVVNPNVKPIASKPMSDTPKPKKPTGNSATPPKSVTTSKRALETEKVEEKDSKQQKKKRVAEVSEDGHVEEADKKPGEDSKKMFQRVWNDDDEIVILKGMLNFLKKGKNPSASPSEFLESIKDSLHVDVNKAQLVSKMQRLKQKYHHTLAKSKPGEEPVISKPHEQKTYQLSKKIWGGGKDGKAEGSEGNGGGSDAVTVDGKKGKIQKSINGLASPKRKASTLLEASPKVEVKREEEGDWATHPCLSAVVECRKDLGALPPGVGYLMSKEVLGLLEPSKRSDLEQKWKKQFAKEAKICFERWELVQETINAAMDAME